MAVSLFIFNFKIEMTDKKLIIKKLTIFLLFIFCLDFTIGYILGRCYLLATSGEDYRTTYVMNSVISDVLILGSSRASRHYDPQIIEDSLKLSTYNGGRYGLHMLYYYALLKSVLIRYHPKIVLLDIRPEEFEDDKDEYDRLSVLLPYYESHPEIRTICLTRGPFEKYKLISKIYPYNSKLLSLLTTVFHLKHKVNEAKMKGYTPVNDEIKGAIRIGSFSKQMDLTKILYFKKFIKDCQEAKVKIVVVISPVYIKFTYNNTITTVRKICNDKNVPFLDYSNSKDFSEPKLYFDSEHLNKVGSALFTKIFARDLNTKFNIRK